MLDLKWIKEPIVEPEKTEKLNIADNVMINKDIIKNLNPDDYSDEELYRICVDFDRISNILFRDQETLIRLLSHVRFVTILTQVAYKRHWEEFQRIQICNAIYVLTKKHDITDQIRALLVNLSKVINKDLVPKLIELGFKEDLSGAICVARFSSYDSKIQIRRINWQLINISQEIDINTVVKLYEALDYFGKFGELFNGLMYDVIPLEQMNEKQKYNYSIISTSIFVMLDGIPMDICYRLLFDFAQNRSYYYRFPLRVNINSCSTEYPRLIQVLQNLRMYDNIVVPYI